MLKKAKYWFRNIFGFSQTETNGAIVMIFLMIIMFIVPPLLNKVDFITYNHARTDSAILDSLITQLENKEKEKVELLASVSIEYQSFDPNTASEETLLGFGIPQKVVKRMINYREKGGKFGIKSDLMKVYEFPSEKYNDLYEYIDLPEKKPAPVASTLKPPLKDFSAFPKKEKIPLNFDINKADTTQLKAIKGIGTTLSARIVKYRNNLGGFISKDQFSEIYGLEESAVQELIKSTIIDPQFEPQKININNSDLQELAAHPYISKKLAQRIISFRDNHGPFNKEQKLNDVKELDEEIKIKIYPYLDF